MILHFAELYFGAPGGGTGGTGQRVFSVTAEGQSFASLTDIDLNAIVAPVTATTVEVELEVEDGLSIWKPYGI